MTTNKTRWLLVGLVCLALWPAHPSAQGSLWETYMAAATKAYQQGNYPEAGRARSPVQQVRVEQISAFHAEADFRKHITECLLMTRS